MEHWSQSESPSLVSTDSWERWREGMRCVVRGPCLLVLLCGANSRTGVMERVTTGAPSELLLLELVWGKEY